MTLTKYDRFAIIPLRCDKCNRLFIFESYNIVERCLGIDQRSVPFRWCKKCVDKYNNDRLFHYSVKLDCPKCGYNSLLLLTNKDKDIYEKTSKYMGSVPHCPKCFTMMNGNKIQEYR